MKVLLLLSCFWLISSNLYSTEQEINITNCKEQKEVTVTKVDADDAGAVAVEIEPFNPLFLITY